jgi:hypothetical protein
MEGKLGGPTNAAIRTFLREEELSVLNLLPSFGATTLAMNYEACVNAALKWRPTKIE